MARVDKKELFWFLGLTFTPVVLLPIFMRILFYFLGERVDRFFAWFRASEMSWTFLGGFVLVALLAGAIWLAYPILTMRWVRRHISHDTAPIAGKRIGDHRHYLLNWFLVLGLYAVIFVLSGLFLNELVPALQGLKGGFAVLRQLSYKDVDSIVTTFIGAITMGTFLSGLMNFPIEFTWRGYFLPRLLPLGLRRALLLSAAVSALWVCPFILFLPLNLREPDWSYLNQFALTLLFFIYLGYLRLTSGSLLLPALIAGLSFGLSNTVRREIFEFDHAHAFERANMFDVAVWAGVAAWVLTRGVKRLREQGHLGHAECPDGVLPGTPPNVVEMNRDSSDANTSEPQSS